MNPSSTPPTVRPMTEQTRQRIRRALLARANQRHRSHGWAPAMIAVATVTAVVATAVAAGQLLRPEPMAPQESGSVSSPVRPDPDAIVIDRGAPTAAQLSAAKKSCLGNRNAAGATVVFARQVMWRPAPIMPLPVTALVIRMADGGHMACHSMDNGAVGRLPVPTASDPVRSFAISGLATYYRVHSSVARLETRVSFPETGRTSDWSVAFISNGIAYALGDVDQSDPPRFEIRAFDAAGRQIATQPHPAAPASSGTPR